MSVKVRPYRRGGWEVDVRVQLPDGRERRERKRAPASSRSAAIRWGEARERELLVHGPPQLRRESPTLSDFWPRFLDGYARANRQKPSGIAAKETIGHVHLNPTLGNKRLDAITTETVQQLKHQLTDRAPKTVNNVLTVLNVLLKKAVEWDVIERMPCTIRLLPIPKGSAGFYDFDEYERLVGAAQLIDRNAYLIALLGGEAGLRCGEMMALECSVNAAAHRSRRRSSRSTSDAQPGVRSSRRAASIGCGTRSVHTSRCVGRPHERFRSSPVTWISPRRSGTCT